MNTTTQDYEPDILTYYEGEPRYVSHALIVEGFSTSIAPHWFPPDKILAHWGLPCISPWETDKLQGFFDWLEKFRPDQISLVWPDCWKIELLPTDDDALIRAQLIRQCGALSDLHLLLTHGRIYCAHDDCLSLRYILNKLAIKSTGKRLA